MRACVYARVCVRVCACVRVTFVGEDFEGGGLAGGPGMGLGQPPLESGARLCVCVFLRVTRSQLGEA